MPYTLIEQSSLHTGMATCVKRGVSVIVGAPFASGILVTGSGSNAKYGYANAAPEVQAKVRGIEAVVQGARRRPCPPRRCSSSWRIPRSSRPSPARKAPNEVRENIASLQAPIPAAFWSDLKAQKLIDPESPVPGGA